MPLYEYRCRACETEFEVIQKVSDPPLTECRSCDGTVDKLISQSAFQFRGTGWYVTDYARKDKSKSDKSEAASDKSDSSDSSSKPDAGKATAGKSDGGKTDKGSASSKTSSGE